MGCDVCVLSVRVVRCWVVCVGRTALWAFVACLGVGGNCRISAGGRGTSGGVWPVRMRGTVSVVHMLLFAVSEVAGPDEALDSTCVRLGVCPCLGLLEQDHGAAGV